MDIREEILKRFENTDSGGMAGGRNGLTQREKILLNIAVDIASKIALKQDVMQSFCVCAHGFKKKNFDCCAICGGKWKGRPKQNVA